MVAVDTNIIVRFLTQDDPEQFQKSVAIFEYPQIFIPDTVVLETEWVLRYAYKYSPDQIMTAFKSLFGLPNVHLRDAAAIALAIEWRESGLAFADAFHLAQAQHCQQMMSFDQRFVKRSRQIGACPVTLPA
ncbi:MAG TPA: type II toxin-antitoxin system VapC family toxin [Anaerolineae bacterium]|nr:type II toxin-antitoxin system VapC family toxin [Anaerolineae bacterium]